MANWWDSEDESREVRRTLKLNGGLSILPGLMATLSSLLVQWFLVSEIHLPGTAEATVVQSHLRYIHVHKRVFLVPDFSPIPRLKGAPVNHFQHQKWNVIYHSVLHVLKHCSHFFHDAKQHKKMVAVWYIGSKVLITSYVSPAFRCLLGERAWEDGFSRLQQPS